MQICWGASPTLPTCPIGTDGAPYLRDPGIASGSQCRGACGSDCPADRCDPVADITIPVYDSSGTQYNCTYNNVLNCLTHEACREHDACYDRCAASGESSLIGACHRACNDDCFNRWGYAQCAAWSDVVGYRLDYYVDPDYDGVMLFSDAPVLMGPVSSSCSWTGTWETNWGPMELQQTGNAVTGTYTHDQGRIQFTVSDNETTGTWSEAPSYSPTHDAGDVELVMSEDCRSFSGKWRYGSEGDWSGDWTGTRK